MKVEQIIKMLQKLDPKLRVELEGCDCAGECVGYTIIDNYGGYKKKTLFLRVKRGVFHSEEEILT